VLFHTSTIPRNHRLCRLTALDGFNSNNPKSRLKYATSSTVIRKIGKTPQFQLTQGVRYVLLTSKGYLMGLITKKDVIRNMARLEEEEPENDDDQEFAAYEAQESGLLDDEEDNRRSNETD
jgi:hypothetical protein